MAKPNLKLPHYCDSYFTDLDRAGTLKDTPLPELKGQMLKVKLSTGDELGLELWEREPGVLQVRSQVGYLVIKPEAANVVSITTTHLDWLKVHD